MNVVELFAGGGGAATGLARAGLEHLACVEWDREACGVARRLGLPVVRADVGRLPLNARPDLVWASPPCQPYSSAGKRAGKDDERDGFPMMFAALAVLRPTWLLIEQVPGLTMHLAKGCGNAATCPGCCLEREILPALRARFAVVEHRVLSAADFGAPQDRRRFIIACGPRAFPWPAPTHTLAALSRAKRDGSYWRRHGVAPRPLTSRERAADDGTGSLFEELDDARPWRTVRDALGDLEQVGNAGPWVLVRSAKDCEGSFNKGPTLDDSAAAVTAQPNLYVRPDVVLETGSNVGGFANAERQRCSVDAASPTIRVAGRYALVLDTGQSDGREAPRTLDEEASTVSGRGNAILRTLDDPAYAVTGHDAGVAHVSRGDLHTQARRRLTPAECALLQAWPEVIPALAGCRTKLAQYRIVGNAVSPPMAEALGRALLSTEK